MKSFSKIKFTQIAIWVPDVESCLYFSKKFFPNVNIQKDDLLMNGKIINDTINSKLSLSFIFGLIDGLEIEYITPKSEHWLSPRAEELRPFISHLGAYCDIDLMNDCILEARNMEIEILQKTISHSHSNKRDNGIEREYFDVIFNTENHIGFNIKLSAKSNGKTLKDLK